MQITEADAAQSGDVGETRIGRQDSRLLVCGQDGTPDNYKLNLSYAVTDWIAPRHHHNFDQFRYVLSGDFYYAKDKKLPAGQVAYFPEGIYYGPQTRVQGAVLVLCQLGGASGNGFLSKMQRRQAHDELLERGTFSKGVYTWIDENGQKHNQDSSEAVSEQAMKGKLVYPEPRYDDIIVMNPASYEWIEKPGSPGVATKWLGTFTERESKVGFIRLDAGATFDAGMIDTIELFFLVTGKVECVGKVYNKHTGFSFDPFEGPIPLKALEPCEFFCIQVTRFHRATAAMPKSIAAE